MTSYSQTNSKARIAVVSTRTLRYYDDDIIGLYQGNPKNKGGIVLFFTLKRESIVRREVIQHHF